MNQGDDIKGLRSLRVLVVHPSDSDRHSLVQHLTRIGCQVEAQWPPPAAVPGHMDVVFLMFQQDGLSSAQQMLDDDRLLQPTLIAIVDYENPTVLQAVLDSGAQAVIGKPIRPFGVLTNLVLARTIWEQRRTLEGRITKLERRIRGFRKISQAKSILMASRSIGEDEAYRIIRDQAMAQRVTMEELAETIIRANEVLQASPISD